MTTLHRVLLYNILQPDVQVVDYFTLGFGSRWKTIEWPQESVMTPSPTEAIGLAAPIWRDSARTIFCNLKVSTVARLSADLAIEIANQIPHVCVCV